MPKNMTGTPLNIFKQNHSHIYNTTCITKSAKLVNNINLLIKYI